MFFLEDNEEVLLTGKDANAFLIHAFFFISVYLPHNRLTAITTYGIFYVSSYE